jgi:Arc/MetJ-type ribon-helix-helix transcriptional regulator
MKYNTVVVHMKNKLAKPRKKRTVRIKLDLQQWVEEQVKKGRFQNFSDAVDVALEKLRDVEKA